MITPRKILLILANTCLEWVLIILLLLNSFFSHLIRRFAVYFNLKPPCIWCSRVDHHHYESLFCETHAREISKLTYCLSHRRLVKSESFCEECRISSQVKKHCEEEDGVRNEKETKIEGMKLDEYVGKQIENDTRENQAFPTEGVELEDHLHLSISAHNKDLKAQVKELKSELEAERSAAAIAANQTMAMITRLQEEKAALQMDALQYQRVMEEQAEYDQEALHLLKEVVVKREREKEELENEVELLRERVSDYKAKDKAMMMMVQKCGDLSSSSCSLEDESDVLSIELNRLYDEDDDNKGHKIKDISLLDCAEQWGVIEDSLEELEEERLSIIKKLKELEEKLENEQSLAHDVKPSEQEKVHCIEEPPNASLCNQEVNLKPSSCFSIEQSHPKTMASVAQKLLDLVETQDMALSNEREDELIWDMKMESGSKRLAIEKEMDHVYGRLQALETDMECLRHCIGFVRKGNNKGVNESTPRDVTTFP